MDHFVKILLIAAMVFSAAIFGFFYAWVCSTMWGLDSADPQVAIAAMQAMNASVRNAVFAPAFFGTPFVSALAGAMLWRLAYRRSAMLCWLSSAVYICLGLVLTVAVNVPMNEALAAIKVPEQVEAARIIWQEYSPRWQTWNVIRTIGSGLSFVILTLALLSYGSSVRSR